MTIRFPPFVDLQKPPKPMRYEVWSRWLSLRIRRLFRRAPDAALSVLALSLLAVQMAFLVYAFTGVPQ